MEVECGEAARQNKQTKLTEMYENNVDALHTKSLAGPSYSMKGKSMFFSPVPT